MPKLSEERQEGFIREVHRHCGGSCHVCFLLAAMDDETPEPKPGG